MGSHERSALDEAWSAWLAGDTAGSLRLCVALVESDPAQLPALALIANALASKDRDAAGRAAVKLSESYLRRGDLPEALAAAHVAERTGRDPKPLRHAIALAFGQGSKRAKDVARRRRCRRSRWTSRARSLRSTRARW